MTEIAPDAYKVDMQLRVAAVGGSFEGEIALFGQGSRRKPAASRSPAPARSATATAPPGSRLHRKERIALALIYQGIGEIGGLVAGVGQRILSSVSKHLVGRFFVALRKEFETICRGRMRKCGSCKYDCHGQLCNDHRGGMR